MAAEQDPVNGPPFIRSLDFSEFHPLSHSLARCRGYPGGRRRHLRYRWEFQWRVRTRLPLCWLGRHRRVQWWRAGNPAGVTCARCNKELPDARP